MNTCPARLALVVALCLCGCTQALLTHTHFRSGPTGGRPDVRQAAIGPDLTKADVLATLGAPGEVIPQAGGDIFVYRLRQVDLQVLNLNPFILLGVGVPVYASLKGLRVDDVLFIHFDGGGRVRDVSSAWRP